MFDSLCVNAKCPAYARKFEWLQHPSDMPDPDCPQCGRPTVRVIPVFRIGNTVPFDAHTVFRKRTAANPDSPEPIRISSYEQQREFCHDEGLLNPGELPPVVRVNKDGTPANTQGLPGCWV